MKSKLIAFVVVALAASVVQASSQTTAPPACPGTSIVGVTFRAQLSVPLVPSEANAMRVDARVGSTVHQLPAPSCSIGAGPASSSCTVVMPPALGSDVDHDVAFMLRDPASVRQPGPWTPTCRYRIASALPAIVFLGFIPGF